MKMFLLTMAFAWIVFVAVPTFPIVRDFLASPLVIEDRDPRGDACYVLADADAFRERLGAAAYLYLQGRVSKIVFMRDDLPNPYNTLAETHWTPTDWAMDFLIHRGVPREKIQLLDPAGGMFGTLQEARNFKKSLPRDLKTLVLVSSAPHMRRSVLAFRRVLPQGVTIISCPATPYSSSYEYFYPLWIEYLKLAVYTVVAR